MGADLATNVRQLLSAVISPELARNLSLKGKNSKFQLSGTSILDVITGRLKGPLQIPCHSVNRNRTPIYNSQTTLKYSACRG